MSGERPDGSAGGKHEPPVNRRIIIGSLPAGALQADDYELQTEPAPQPAAGEVLVRTMALTIGAGQRAGLQGSAGYAGSPTTGIVMGGTGVGRVVTSRAEGIDPGDLVAGLTGWQDYAILRPGDVRVVDPDVDPALHLSLFGTNGLTAYFGLFEVGRPEPGETVLVSAASGSVGHLVGQFARARGCRVIGVTGSDAKMEVLTGRLGFDAAVNHRSPTFRQELKAVTGDGVDVYFDNTGGDILGAALRRMNPHGRIVCCGVVSQYDTDDPQPGPRGIPGLLVNKRVRMEGFLVFDFADRFEEARRQLRTWLDTGAVESLHDEVTGLDNAPAAFVDLLAGGNIGTRIVRVG
ncbi:MAG: NADP-dependent oxidoreductase [Acidimicrobiales bacterium]